MYNLLPTSTFSNFPFHHYSYNLFYFIFFLSQSIFKEESHENPLAQLLPQTHDSKRPPEC